MALVTITGNTVRDSVGRKDNRPWYAWAADYQDGNPGVVTPRRSKPLIPSNGVLTFEIEAGISAWIENPDKQRYLVTIPLVNGSLWEVIEAGVAIPPNTSAQQLATMFENYLTDHPIADTVADYVDTNVTPQLPAVITPIVTAAIAEDGTVVAAAADAVDGALDAAGVVYGASDISVDDVALAFTDELGNASWLAVDLDGGVPNHTRDMILDAIDLSTQLAAEGAVTGGSELPDASLSLAFTDADGNRSDLELDTEGHYTDRVLELWRPRLQVLTGLVPELASADRVFLVDHATGERTLLGTVAGASSPTMLDGSTVRVETSGGPKWLSTTVSTPRPVFPTATIACVGDSLTYSSVSGGQASPTWPQTIATDLGVTVYNGGKSGHGSAEIATRQGGLQPLCTLTGNQIPSGSTAPILLTSITPPYTSGWRPGGSGSLYMSGSLAGVAGLLSHDLATPSNFYFTPNSAPVSTVPVPANTPFIGDEMAAMRDRIQIIWAGTNNIAQTAAITRDIASMVEWLTPYTKRFLVVSNTLPDSQSSGLNSILQYTYGDRYADLRGYLISDGLADLGITPTSTDLADMAAGNVPTSLLWDGTHFTQEAYTLIGHWFADLITSKNWI